MKKTLFAIISFCLAASTAFAQNEIHLNEDKPQDEIPIDINGHEQGRLFIKINGEPDNQGRSPVQIQLENNSDDYEFLLFDHICSKKELRKNKIYFDKGYIGRTTLKVENIDLDASQGYLIPPDPNIRYTFPDILVEEGKTYNCKIPIHLAKPKRNWFCKKKKKLYDIITYTLDISVENKDKAYDKLKHECDSLLAVFNEALASEKFCTNSHHRPSFKVQTEKYTTANHKLREQINENKGWSKESNKYKRYNALLESLDKMDYALEQYKHDCGKHNVKKHNCPYCKLSLQEIYNRLNRHYIDLHNGTVQQTAIINEVNALYKCCTDSSCAKHAQQWKNNDSLKASIIECYKKIMAY